VKKTKRENELVDVKKDGSSTRKKEEKYRIEAANFPPRG